MKNILLNTIKLFAISIALSTTASAETREISDLTEVLDLAKEQIDLHGTDEVAVVFDIDNTLLASTHSLGSDQWYEWQSGMIKEGKFESTVANNIGGLLDIVTTLYSLAPMRLTQPNTDKIVKQIQQLESTVIALTARGSVNRDATLRELKKNNIELSSSSFDETSGFPGLYLPLDPKKPQIYGLSQQDVIDYKVQKPRKVSFEHGVMMVAGQHKGAMLRTLLQKAGSKPAVVIFVDDKLKNVKNVDNALEAWGIESFALRYSGEDERVEKFENSNKSKVIADWQKLEATLEAVLP